MRTADLTGALLDYWTARAEGVPADQLEIRNMPRPDDPRAPKQICVRTVPCEIAGVPPIQKRIDYSTNWALAGPLVEKHEINLHRWKDDTEFWAAEFAYESHYHDVYADDYVAEGCDTPLIAICRAVVRAAFGDEVEDLPCA